MCVWEIGPGISQRPNTGLNILQDGTVPRSQELTSLDVTSAKVRNRELESIIVFMVIITVTWNFREKFSWVQYIEECPEYHP